MAYLDEMALEREKSKQAMIAGKQPLLGADTSMALHQLGISLGVMPPGTPPSQTLRFLEGLVKPPGKVRVDETKPLQVQPLVGRLQASLQPAAKSDDSVGNALTSGFSAAKDKALQRALTDQQRAQEQERQSRQQPTTPGAPGAPNANLRAAAYRGRVPHSPEGATYKDDLKYLTDRGGHFSVLKDGKITNVPVGTPGAYGNLDPELAARLRAAGEAFEKANPGKQAKFGEFSRGADVQKIYHDRYKAGGGIAAAPGQSRHQHGAAGDLPDSPFRKWLYQGNQDKFGLHFPVKGDAPHVEVNPAHKQSYSSPTGVPTAPVTPAAPAAAAPAGPAPAAAAPAAPAPGGFPRTATEPYHPPHPGHVPGEQPPAPAPAPTPKPAAAIEAPGAETVLAAAPALAPTPQTPQTPPAAPTAQPAAGGSNVLAEQRKPIAQFFDGNPTAKDQMAAVAWAEDNNSSQGRIAVHEAGANRVTASGRPVTDIIDPKYYQPMHDPAQRPKYEAALQRIQTDPQFRAQLHAEIDQAHKQGTNHAKLATDFASGDTAARARATATSVGKVGGNEFYIKDKTPGVHGPGTVAANQKWKAETEAKLRGQSTASAQPAPQAAPQASPQAPPQAAAAPSAATGPAAPVVAPPTAAAPVPPAAAPAAAKPAPAVNPAHAILDTKVIDLVRKGDPSKASQVPSFIADKTLREAMNMPIVGGQITTGVKPFLGKMGVTQQQFDQAVKEGPPKPAAAAGKRSEAPIAPELQKVRYAAADTGTMTDAGPELPDDGSTVAATEAVGTDQEVTAPTPNATGAPATVDPDSVVRTSERDPASVVREGEANTRMDPASVVRGSEQPTMTPEMAKAFMDSVKDQSRVAPAMPPPADALPVLPAQPAAPASDTGAGGLSLAPSGLSSIPTGALNTGPLPSQGGSIAMAGVLPPIQNATFSTPLLDQAARSPTMGLSPIPWQTLGGWGWGGGNIGSGFDWGGGGGGGGFSMPMFGGFSGD